MKQLKYLAMAALMVGFAACSDDDETMNSASATVEFESAAVTYNENYGIVQVPLQVTGELNGSIRATFSVEPLQGAVENEHYVVTTNQILIPSSLDGTFACELHLLDDGVNENDDRAVRITLESVEGATVGTNASCTVTIADVDKIPYYKLLGDYVLTAINPFGGEEVSFNVTLTDGITTADKQANAESRYVAIGFGGEFASMGYSSSENWTIEYNKAAENLSLVPGDYYNDVATINFGFAGNVAVVPFDLLGVSPEGEPDFALGRYLDATWNEGYDTITFAPGYMGIGVFDDASDEFAGYYAIYTNVVMTKVQ